ncbi:MAG: creatininase family protein [Candidatus Latescibacteria bacterium]|nr:creatininase family protein [Candidatus Latescibacterota bacterium]
MRRREVRWDRMFPDELEAAVEACPVVYLPYGLCEPHGPQNALGMDALRPTRILRRVAEIFGGIVAPPEYWHCHESGGYGSWAHPRVGQARPWLTAVPPWVFLKNLCYHIRAVDALGFHAAVLFSGHAGPHSHDVPRVIETMQGHISTRLYCLIGSGTSQSRFDEDKGMGSHAGRGETSLLWAVAPECVDISRMPKPDQPPPHFAMGEYVAESSRSVGEHMVADIVNALVDKAGELLAEYDDSVPRKPSLTFGEVEAVWDDEIRPVFKDFASMQSSGDEPPEDSRWHRNWRLPDIH